MQSTNHAVRKSRRSRRSRRKGPVHFVQGLILQTIGFGALIIAMLGLGRDNWFLSLISSPVSESSGNLIEGANQSGITMPAFQFPETVPMQSINSRPLPNSQTDTAINHPASHPPTTGAYLGHNSPWTSHH